MYPGIDAPVHIPKERYTSAAFAAAETERLWPHVWVIACSSDHVAAPGDYFEFRCGRLSVVIVRNDDGVLRAFQNVCRHRGNALCDGASASRLTNTNRPHSATCTGNNG